MVSAKTVNLLIIHYLNCLNPYYTGRWFLLIGLDVLIENNPSLNPYYTGRWFLLFNLSIIMNNLFQVLILIILEDGFCFKLYIMKNLFQFGLNPYYTGRWFLLSDSTKSIERRQVS